jgi:hypothetical protein
VLAHAVAAVGGGRVIRCGAAVGCMFFSTVSTVFPTFAHHGSEYVAVASVALGQGVVLNVALTIFELPVMKQALLYQSFSFTRGPHLQEKGSMLFTTLQHLHMPVNTKDYDFGPNKWVLGLNVGDRLSLFLLVNLAHFDSIGHGHEPVALKVHFASNDSHPCCVMLKESLS